MNKKTIITALLALFAMTGKDFQLSAFNQIETLTSIL